MMNKKEGTMDKIKINAIISIMIEVMNQTNYPDRGIKASNKQITKDLIILGFTKEESQHIIENWC